ncbi:MAG: hypothetical protein M1838_004628 [Thelocarpon superellum]|nr:MAG: hypothetical protein M1838_004628 [Thelocarpon superellum]
MASTTPIRRSSRKRPRTRYSLDAFEGLDILSDVTPTGSEGQASDDDTNRAGDDDFAAELSDDEPSSEGERSSGGGDDFEQSDEGGLAGPSHGPRRRGRHRRTDAVARGDGLTPTRERPGRPAESSRSYSKQDRYVHLFGPRSEDLINFVRSRDKWSQNATMPAREPNGNGHGGLAPTFFQSSELRLQEAVQDWRWYQDDGGRETFAHQQTIRRLAEDEQTRYTVDVDRGARSFLVGPADQQTRWTLPARESYALADLWKEKEVPSSGSRGPLDSAESESGQRDGFMLNVGAQVDGMGWAPNHNSERQYLAVIVSPSPSKPDPPETPQPIPEGDAARPAKAPAYAPSDPTPACLQIWTFCAAGGAEDGLSIKSSAGLRLSAVFCTDWGDGKQLRWCPAPRHQPETSPGEAVRVGLLAGIWTDGKVRVLDVHVPKKPEHPVEYAKIDAVAFEAIPPGTLCTCVDWLSSSHVAVGCANGFVAIWDLARHLAGTGRPRPTPASSPRPFFYQLLHQAYLLSITACYPSHPTLIATTSMDGYVRLTSIHDPSADYVSAQRSRVAPNALVWSDAIQSMLGAEENNMIRTFAMRRFFSTLTVARPTSVITSLAVGSTHTSLLAGCANGTVVAVNPMRRVVKDRGSMPSYQQIWFQHEWRPEDRADAPHRGLSRISEGFKVERPNLFRGLGEDKVQGGILMATIFEQKTAITHVEWNPNVVCGGWAAAAMGDGLIRIEDLALS